MCKYTVENITIIKGEEWIQSDFFIIWEKLARNEEIKENIEKSVIYKEEKKD